MGRPKKDEAEKRQQVNVRLLPAHRAALVAAAEESGLPVAAEAERIIAAHFDRLTATSQQTRDLTSLIERTIAELEAAAKGRWHKNLIAWAAVSEMLSVVLEPMRPERIQDDDIVLEAFRALAEAGEDRSKTVGRLAELGIAVNADPMPQPLLGAKAARGLFGRTPARDPRTWERTAIEAIEDESLRSEALDLFCELLEADIRVANAETAYSQSVLPYVQAEQEGRRLGREAAPFHLNALLKFAISPSGVEQWPSASPA